MKDYYTWKNNYLKQLWEKEAQPRDVDELLSFLEFDCLMIAKAIPLNAEFEGMLQSAVKVRLSKKVAIKKLPDYQKIKEFVFKYEKRFVRFYEAPQKLGIELSTRLQMQYVITLLGGLEVKFNPEILEKAKKLSKRFKLASPYLWHVDREQPKANTLYINALNAPLQLIAIFDDLENRKKFCNLFKLPEEKFSLSNPKDYGGTHDIYMRDRMADSKTKFDAVVEFSSHKFSCNLTQILCLFLSSIFSLSTCDIITEYYHAGDDQDCLEIPKGLNRGCPLTQSIHSFFALGSLPPPLVDIIGDYDHVRCEQECIPPPSLTIS